MTQRAQLPKRNIYKILSSLKSQHRGCGFLVTKSDFVLEWDKALGFRGDPFADKIFAPINTFLVNRKDEKEKLNWFFIKNYSYGALIGEEGVGKTTLLFWLEDRLKKYNRIHAVYINAAVFKEQINIPQKMIFPLLSLKEKLISKPHKKLLSADLLQFLKKKLGQKSSTLIIDNAHHLTETNLELIKNLRKEGLKLQVIVASSPKDYEKSRLRELGQDELGITLRRLTFEEAKEMITKRIEAFGGNGTYPFKEDDLKRMHEKADKNPREFLKLCRDEAIKILIHKRELLEKQASMAGPDLRQGKSLKTAVAKPKPSGEVMDLKIRKADKKEIAEERREDKKKLIRIRFALSNEEEKKKKPVFKPDTDEEKDEHRAIHDEEHKQDLINRMSSTSPRRKQPEPEKKDEDKQAISETDKLLKELAEEFEVD